MRIVAIFILLAMLCVCSFAERTTLSIDAPTIIYESFENHVDISAKESINGRITIVIRFDDVLSKRKLPENLQAQLRTKDLRTVLPLAITEKESSVYQIKLQMPKTQRRRYDLVVFEQREHCYDYGQVKLSKLKLTPEDKEGIAEEAPNKRIQRTAKRRGR